MGRFEEICAGRVSTPDLVWLGGPLAPSIPSKTDIYPSLMASRAVFGRGNSPYSEQVTREIQTGFYGRPLGKGERLFPQRFYYPLYIVFLFLPIYWLPYLQLTRIFTVLFVVSLFAAIRIWLHLSDWRPSLRESVMISLGIMLSPPVAFALVVQNFMILVFLSLSVAAYCATRRKYAASGAALAFATIKPQAIILPLVWLLLWSIRNWKRRRALVFGFLGGVSALFAVSFALLPSWITDFVSASLAYRGSLGFAGNATGLLVSGMLVILMIPMMWKRAFCDEESPEFVRQTAVACTLQFLMIWLLSMPALPWPYQAILLIPSALIWLAPKNTLSPKAASV